MDLSEVVVVIPAYNEEKSLPLVLRDLPNVRRVIANGDMRLQLFLAEHTSHLEDIPAATPVE